MTTRIPPIPPGTRPALAAQEAAIAAERGSVSLLYQVLLNSPPLAHGWEQMLTAVRKRSSLPAALRELVILRVAVLNRAPYEFEAHAPIARAAGVADLQLAALREAVIGPQFTPTERAALVLTDTMTREIEVPDAVYAAAAACFDTRGLTNLLVTIAAYNMVSRFLAAARIH